MTGGLIELISIGEQDRYIINKPEITFFKTVYRRHTNFAIETREEFFSGTPKFGQKTQCILKKDGDLLHKLCVKIKLPSLNMNMGHQGKNVCIRDVGCDCFCNQCQNQNPGQIFGWVNSIGHVLIQYVDIWIGGCMIDRHYGEWLEIWSELTQTEEKRLGYYELIGKVPGAVFKPTTFSDEMELLVPFNFWFCRNTGLSLPLIALEKHDVVLNIKWRDFDDCWVSTLPDSKPMTPEFQATLYVDYIYLDLFERAKFTTDSHLYLIEQVQSIGDCIFDKNVGTVKIDIDKFRHPCKEIIWAIQRTDTLYRSLSDQTHDFTHGNDWFNFTAFKSWQNCKVKDTFDTAQLQFSGQDRNMPLTAKYYRLLQSYYYHTRTPTNYIYTFSFGLKPEEHQPTGTFNMSCATNARLIIKMNPERQSDFLVKTYATSYNLLVITGGMGALGFQL